MKKPLAVIFATIFCLSVSVYAQNVGNDIKLTITSSNITLAQVFQQIKKQTGLTVFYNNSILNDLEKITVNFKKASLTEVLDFLLAKRNISYEIRRDRVIVLNKKAEPTTAINNSSKTMLVVGKITDEKGAPLPGVSVKVKGTSTGATSNEEGNYTITVKEDAVLVFSFIGFTPQEVKVAQRKTINIVMKTQSTGLDEVVVIGYGAVQKQDLTGSVGQVKIDEMRKAPVSSIDQALAGRVAGVSVSANDGQPGSPAEIVIRGGTSLTQSNTPLYVIDGFPVEDFSLASLNPNDIQSINILKDASATAIYGSRGANGVVVIETKSAKGGKTNISYQTGLGFQQVSKTMEMMDPYEFVKYQLELNPSKAKTFYLDNPGRTLEDYKTVQGYDWQDMLFRNGNTQSHSITISGGNAQTKFYLSGSWYDYNGVILNSGYKRAQSRLKLDHNISKALQIGLNLTFTSDRNFGQLASVEQRGSKSYSTYTLYQTWGFRPVFLEDNGFDFENDVTDNQTDDERVNPIVSVLNEIRQKKENTLNTSGYLKYKINNQFEFLSRVGIIQSKSRNEGFYNSKTGRGYPSTTNTRGVNGSIYNNESNNWMNENTLTYRKTINKKNKFDALVGYSIQGRNIFRDGYEAQQIPNEDLGLNGIDNGTPVAIQAETSKNVLISYLSRFNYNYANKYLLTLSMRADGSSKFSKNNRWGYFPSGAFAWRLGNEEFMKAIPLINDAKLRLSYGQTGNNRIDDYGRFSLLDMSYGSYYSFNNGIPSPAVIASRMGNDLKWETTTETNLGLDLSLWKNKISLVADLYKKTTKDLLLNANITSVSGFSSVLKNIGSIQNKGLELTLSTVNINRNKFKWNSEFNISFNSNKVLELAENQESFLSKVSWTYDYNSTFSYITKVGGPATAFYGVVWDGIYQQADFDENGKLKAALPTNGNDRNLIQPGDIKYKDVNADGIINEMDYVIIGRPIPIHTGGFNNNFVYKGLSLNVFFQWSYGGQILNANRLAFEGNIFQRSNLNQYAEYANRWTPENQSNEYFRTRGGGPSGIYSSRNIEDGSFLRLKTISLDYTFSNKLINRIGMKDFSLSVAAQNLYTWTKYKGMDPEVSVRNSTLTRGFDYSAYPMSKILQFGIKANF